MNLLALDLGTHTGWALQENGRIESGVQVFDVKRGESPGMRYVRFRRWLQDMIWQPTERGKYGYPHVLLHEVAARVGLIVYEQSHNRGGAATEVAAGFTTRVQESCAEGKLEHAAVHSATLKKFTTGSGRGDKDKMAAAAIDKGWLTEAQAELAYDSKFDDNEVDAICLLHYALSELVPKT